MKDKGIFEAIVEHNKQSKMRFHMPSHNSNIGGELWRSAQFDLTELDGLDNLLVCDGVIKNTQNKIAKAYRAVDSLIFTTGSTTAMLTAVGVVKNRGNHVVCVGEMHKSFWNGVLLFGVQAGSVNDIADLDEYMAKSRNISAIFTTSPNYFGECKQLDKLRKIADKYGCLLVVDSAHGSHFAFSHLLPDMASKYAHLSVCSLHKTMACYGGASVLNVCDDELVNTAYYFRNLLHTMSPSYLTMASIDWAIDDMVQNGEKYYQHIKEVVDSLGGSVGEWRVVQNDDFSRLVLQSVNKDARYTAEYLQSQGVWIEMTYQDKMVFILTPYNIDWLVEAMEIVKEAPTKALDKSVNCQLQLDRGNVQGKVEFVEIEQALGKTSASEIGIYPPGVPIVKAGDKIDEEVIKFIKDNKYFVFGLVNGLVAVLQ